MTLYFATSNMGKFREAKAKLKPLQIRRLDLRYPEVQAHTLEDVVAYALQWLKERSSKNVIIEDSGLFIDALKGFPGVYSSYAYKQIGCEGVLALMEGVEDRRAEFQSCVGLLIKGKGTIFNGLCEGSIAFALKGKEGFGFDPIFIPKRRKMTFAEMGLDEKNDISHRAKAIEKTARFLSRVKGI